MLYTSSLLSLITWTKVTGGKGFIYTTWYATVVGTRPNPGDTPLITSRTSTKVNNPIGRSWPGRSIEPLNFIDWPHQEPESLSSLSIRGHSAAGAWMEYYQQYNDCKTKQERALRERDWREKDWELNVEAWDDDKAYHRYCMVLTVLFLLKQNIKCTMDTAYNRVQGPMAVKPMRGNCRRGKKNKRPLPCVDTSMPKRL